MDRVVGEASDGRADRGYGGPEGIGSRELWLTDSPRFVDHHLAADYPGEPSHCGLRVNRKWLVHYDFKVGVQYLRVSEWLGLTGVLPVPDIPVAWWAPEGLRSPTIAWARYSLGQDVHPVPITCVTLIARMFALPKPWPRRPAELIPIFRGLSNGIFKKDGRGTP